MGPLRVRGFLPACSSPRTLAAHVVFKTGLRVGGFDPALYRAQLVQNTDFRKFDDGLRMTLDCTPKPS
jgi:hypothetical protein